MVWWGWGKWVTDMHKISDWSGPQVSALLSDFNCTVHLRLLLDEAGPEEATCPGQVTSPSLGSSQGNGPVLGQNK